MAGPRSIVALARHKLFGNYAEVAARVPDIRTPIQLRVQTSDIIVLRQVLFDREYEPPVPIAPSVIVDAGANIGVTSVYYANRYPAARVFAIEPEPSNFKMLVKNTTFYSGIVPIHGALWNRSTSVAVVGGGEFNEWGATVSETQSTVAVQAFSISDLIRRYEIQFIDILKLDIEGAEVEVFENSDLWIQRIGMLAVETHDRFRPNCSQAFERAASSFPQRCKKGEIEFAFGNRAA